VIFEFWQEHHEEFLDLLRQRDFPLQRIGRYKAMIERLIIRGPDGTWESYDDANNYYKERIDLAEGTRQFYFSVINKLQAYHLNEELPVYRTRKGHFPESDHSKGELDLLPAYERLDTFISCYYDEGYCDTLITDARRIIQRIIVLSRTIEWNSFQEIKDWYRNQGLSEKYLYAVYSALDRFERWWSHGIFPTRSGIQPQLKYVEPSIGALDLTYLQSHLNLLLSHMKEHGYSKDYIRKTKFIASRIIVLSRTIAWDSYENVWKWYQSNNHQDGYLRDVRRILGLLANFHIYSLFPNNGEVQNPLCLRPSAYSNLNYEFRSLVDFGCQVEEKRGLKQSTVHKNRSEISLLLYSLQIAGEDSLSKITECGVVSFFYKDGKYLYGYSTASSIAIFLKDAMEYAPDECGRVLSFVPKIRKSRNNIQYLTDAESDAFCTTLEDVQNGLSYKYRAIGTLLYYTGMRCSDICCLTLDSVDLQRSIIRFTQQKTGNPVEIPLSAVVGNALVDYCVHERPATDSIYLFVTDRAPHRRLIKGGVQWTVTKIMEAAGIRQGEGDRKGGHIFRHRAVSRMAGKNIPSPVISAIVGHTSPKSLDTYLYADMKHIRECALGLEKYPMAEEVFSCV